MDRPSAESIAAQVRQALAEDLGDGDLTAALVPSQTEVQARVVVREKERHSISCRPCRAPRRWRGVT